MKFMRIAQLDAVVTGPDDAALTVVLLHGFGAPGTDLVGLAAPLGIPEARFVFLMAPHLLEPGAPPESAARAWWHIDMVELQLLRMRGDFDALADREPDGLHEAQALVGAALAEIRRANPSTKLVLGGFSQGAMLSANTAFRTETPLDGLVLLSGTYLSRERWRAGMAQRKTLPCFQSHSPDDVVLPIQIARELGADIEGAGIARTWVEFRGGHGIGPTVLAGLRTFLQGLPG